MSLLVTLTRHDARLQYRYGIYAAYAFVIAFYVTVILAGGRFLAAWAVPALVYSDPAAVGFFFLGALVMLERAEGVRPALAASPVTARHYLAAKLVTLGGMSLVACVILMIALGDVPNPALLLAAFALTSVTFLAVGMPIAMRCRTVNGYLVGAAGLLTPVIAPSGLAMLDPMPLWLAVWPPVAQFRLILVAMGYGSADMLEVAFMLAVCAVAAIASLAFAQRSLRRELGK
jgi:fluoroquinolone transport system permease protein